ncbi:hypothetical protein BATDEDRAFT_85425 [Batrachochytrium dendrobatidis JAM81]|uniref:Uncharacterized protein n=2 Tax=Batrachochytrium dendrobatidis TaxID=109871 RepID=F4NVN9_BATDJ|nr:uncharacterized protein BATDEDRAFT_85425 [Batrachochytrium dendrobatidis JAM81]EGF84118.1 hypothetical protein BATDEDRAFT_85425 [Batrachochytrium dendrobatidis JAM81]OAJ36666.1 hypothetical protein BDEG_20816 [Batrachochytrium dendrobatidis JEL423]|eukprot:XP_006676338.1 hypothetical protein BATDEDRAFT_85425 [Batrachochytrium dendrobatidis JAM81]
MVSVEATINSDCAGLKTLLAEYFSEVNMLAKIRDTDSGITAVTIQGHSETVSPSMEYLKDLLLIGYDAAIVWGKKSIVEKENRLSSVTIEDTPEKLKRDPSSEEFLEKHFEEISFGGSAATENLKKVARETFASMINTTGFGVAEGWIPAVKEKHISIKYKGRAFDLEVSSMQSLSEVISTADSFFSQPVPFKMLYRFADNDFIVVTDVKNLRDGFLYYALTVNEELPKKQALRETFTEQGILFEDLMETGDLAITDAELEKYGIAQGGLRTAILAVIKSIIQ